jgi:hypothetical protein
MWAAHTLPFSTHVACLPKAYPSHNLQLTLKLSCLKNDRVGSWDHWTIAYIKDLFGTDLLHKIQLSLKNDL